MSGFESKIQKLKEKCVELGGQLVECDSIYINLHSPFDSRIGLDWNSRTVFCSYDSSIIPSENVEYMNNIILCGIIHEMAHVFASYYPPENSEEFEFLGWEMALASEIGIDSRTWRDGQENYWLGLNYSTTLDKLPDQEFENLLNEMMETTISMILIENGKVKSLQ